MVFSIRDIEPDEEICFNYQGIYPGDEDDEEEPPEEENDEPKDKIYTKCLCGAKSCRGDVEFFTSWGLDLTAFQALCLTKQFRFRNMHHSVVICTCTISGVQETLIVKDNYI